MPKLVKGGFVEQRCVGDGGELKLIRQKPSIILPPLIWGAEEKSPLQTDPPGTVWRHWEVRGHYYGVLREWKAGSPLGGGPWACLSISSVHEDARHDWREFQQLKNATVGPDWEGVELYPSESRLTDPSNRFYVWCFPPGMVPWGFPARRVEGPKDGGPPQRGFAGEVFKEE